MGKRARERKKDREKIFTPCSFFKCQEQPYLDQAEARNPESHQWAEASQIHRPLPALYKGSLQQEVGTISNIGT